MYVSGIHISSPCQGVAGLVVLAPDRWYRNERHGPEQHLWAAPDHVLSDRTV